MQGSIRLPNSFVPFLAGSMTLLSVGCKVDNVGSDAQNRGFQGLGQSQTLACNGQVFGAPNGYSYKIGATYAFTQNWRDDQGPKQNAPTLRFKLERKAQNESSFRDIGSIEMKLADSLPTRDNLGSLYASGQSSGGRSRWTAYVSKRQINGLVRGSSRAVNAYFVTHIDYFNTEIFTNNQPVRIACNSPSTSQTTADGTTCSQITGKMKFKVDLARQASRRDVRYSVSLRNESGYIYGTQTKDLDRETSWTSDVFEVGSAGRLRLTVSRESEGRKLTILDDTMIASAPRCPGPLVLENGARSGDEYSRNVTDATRGDEGDDYVPAGDVAQDSSLQDELCLAIKELNEARESCMRASTTTCANVRFRGANSVCRFQYASSSNNNRAGCYFDNAKYLELVYDKSSYRGRNISPDRCSPRVPTDVEDALNP